MKRKSWNLASKRSSGATRSLRILMAGIAALGLTRISAEEAAPGDASPAIQFQVLDSQEVVIGNRSIFYNRVAPPVLPVAVPVAAPEAVKVDPSEPLQAQKKHEVLFLSATVYGHRLTELRWFDGARQYHAFSNIDFNLFAGVGGFKTAEASYTLIMGIGNADGEPAQGMPRWESFSRERGEYRVVAADVRLAIPAGDLTALDALHAYYNANAARLVQDAAQRDADRTTREQWLKDHPPQPKNTVIYYWKRDPAAVRATMQEAGR